MEYHHISELRECANAYLFLLQNHIFGYNEPTNESVKRLHKAIANIKLNEIGKVLSRFNVNQTSIITEVEHILNIVNGMVEQIGDNMPKLMKIDPEVSNVFQFCNDLNCELGLAKIDLEVRRLSDPSFEDEKANEKLQLFIGGQYGDMSFDIFMSRFIINNVADLAEKRRLKYLIANCNDDGIKEQLRRYLEQCVMDIDDHNIELILVPEPSPSSGNSYEVATPIIPTVSFDMSGLYLFLIDERVIDVDEKLFSYCVSHAHINKLWNSNHVVKKRKRNLLQCLFKMLAQDYYPEIWIKRCVENLNVKNKKIITNPTTSGATVKFEDKLRRILKGKTIK